MSSSEGMPAWQRSYIAVCSGIIGFSVAYVICDYAAWPRLTYFPYERTWELIVRSSSPVPSNYVGTILWGVCAALGVTGLAYVLLGWARAAWPVRWLQLIGAWTLTGFFYAGLYYTWSLWPF